MAWSHRVLEYGLMPVNKLYASKGDLTMAKTFAEIASVCEREAQGTLKEVVEALHKGDLVAYNKGMSALKEKVSNLNLSVCNVEYDKFMQAENPMIAAVKQFYIEVFKIKEERDKDSDLITGVSLEKKKARIDLEKFCDFGRLDKTWASKSAKLLALLTLRETDVYSIKASDLSKKSYYFISAATKKKNGETPDSNTRQGSKTLPRHLQDGRVCGPGHVSLEEAGLCYGPWKHSIFSGPLLLRKDG